jgi:hypothetical protein
MAEDDFPDVEEGVRQFLRDDTDVNAIVSRRVFFGVPKESPQFPLVTVRRVGGGDDSSEAAVDLAVLSINCWGGSTKTSAWSAASAVRRSLRKIRSKTLLTPGVYAHGTTVDGVIWSPDPEDARPRYIVTVRVTATAT